MAEQACDCGRELDADENSQCRVCSDPGAYSATIQSSGTSKTDEIKRKEDHVW